MSLLSPEDIFNTQSYSYNASTSPCTGGPVNEGLEFLVVGVIWYDIFACVSTGRTPRLPYHRWLSIPGLNTADLMGCQNWVMVVIGDLTHLEKWKEHQDREGTLSVRELANRAQGIENRLESGIESLDLARVRSRPKYPYLAMPSN